MLQRDIEGEHYGFMAGNKLYYVAGSFGAYWHEYWESETLGFTHPMFRDGRARGNAVVDAEVGGYGHDSWGWEFWRKTRSAYGTLIVDGEEHVHPKPRTLDWRPDKMVASYDVGGVQIREDKFISRDDVLTTVIIADQDVEIRFEGESFWDGSKVPTFDGDNIEGSFSRTCESESERVWMRRSRRLSLPEAMIIVGSLKSQNPMAVPWLHASKTRSPGV
jgi:hypothetical protein